MTLRYSFTKEQNRKNLKQLLNYSDVIIDQEILIQRYLQNTLTIDREILCAVAIKDWSDLRLLLCYANKNKLHIYPISTGKNWGYGCSLPIIDSCILTDLSEMQKIISFDNESGILTIEPGVTQQILYNFLNENNYSYIVPTTGAGPNCSLIGNILERGFGLAPINDHVTSVTSIHAMLANGTMYEGSFPKGFELLETRYPHSIGADFSKLLIQSNFSVVTQMSIQLMPKPACCQLVTLMLKESDIEEEISLFIRKVHREVGRDHMSNISLMSTDRFLKFSGIASHGIIDKMVLKKSNNHKWLLFFALYGNQLLMPTFKKLVKSIAPGKVNFYSSEKINAVNMIFNKVNYFGSTRLKQWFYFCETALLAFSGIPTERGLQLVYNKLLQMQSNNKTLNPSVDECGFYWCTLILPLKAETINYLIKIVSKKLLKYDIPKHLSFTSINSNMIIASLPLSYDKNNRQAAKKCYQCYLEILNECLKYAIYPQRLSILSMPNNLPNINKMHWEVIHKIKKVLDPNNVISPGRYELYE